MLKRTLIVVYVVFCSVCCVHGFFEGLYCGKENCYDLLGVKKDTSKAEIARAYRQLAKKYHPDMHKTKKAKQVASEKFTQIAVAYETLKDDETRRDYDDMLENPENVYRHYYRYYRHRMTPQVDVRIVIVATITVISVVQYYTAWTRYKEAISHLITVPKYKLKALEIAKEQGLFNANSKKRDRRPKELKKEEEEAILKKIVEENIDIRGGYSKPSLQSILWIQLILLIPYTIPKFFFFYLRWFWKFTLKGEEYGEEEKLYLIRRNMKLSQGQWNDIEASEKESYLKEQLWIYDNFKVWKQIKEDEMKAKLAESARYKSYRRFMRNHGPGQITFED